MKLAIKLPDGKPRANKIIRKNKRYKVIRRSKIKRINRNNKSTKIKTKYLLA